MKKITAILITLISINGFSLFGGGGSGNSSYWQMKTYFESVAINAQTLKTMQHNLNQINHMIEQARRMPDEFLQTHMKEYTDIIVTLGKIQNNTKSVLRDAKKAELWFEDVYSDVDNKNYKKLLDRFTTSLDNLSYDAMKTAGLASEASKKSSVNARTLVAKAKVSKNPVQLLEVLSSWSSNLSSQLNTITEVLASDSRLKALENAEKAQERKLSQQRHQYTKKSLEKTIEKLENEKR